MEVDIAWMFEEVAMFGVPGKAVRVGWFTLGVEGMVCGVLPPLLWILGWS